MSGTHISSIMVRPLLLIIFMALTVPSVSFAKGKGKKASAKAKKAKKAASGKLDISDLEQKYWAPKDTDFGVVQNRTYTKEKKLSTHFMYGPILGEGFNQGNGLSVGLSYFLDERHGFTFDYTNYSLTDSEAVDAFKTELTAGVAPDMGRPDSYMGVSYNWVPFYAKMSVLGKKIIYFDMVVSPGIGMTKYTQQTLKGVGNEEQSAMTLALDISQYYFLNKRYAIRVDLRNRWFNEDVISYRYFNTLRSKKTHNMFFLIGVQFFFDTGLSKGGL